MSTATVSPFIDRWHPKSDRNNPGKEVCAVSMRITFQRKKKYYPTGISLPEKDFKRIMMAKRRSEADKEIYNKIHSFENKAISAVKVLPVFTFGKFEEIYLENREAADSIARGFDKYIAELKTAGRIGTAVSYETAKNSLEQFKAGLRFADVSSTLLQQYENWMLNNEKSRTTVGIYLRSLRTIFNRASIDKSIYPFGGARGKYSIPTSKNTKKALNLEEISRIFKYHAETGSTEEMARDYWIFIYLCNGLNVKDLCLLKRKDIDGNVLAYERAKTKRSKKEAEKIIISLKPEARAIINKWGQHSLDPDNYIFPHLHRNMSAVAERKVIQQLTKTINKYMKRVADKMDIRKNVTTYFARHSFATILKNSGVSVEFISEALGHADIKTTKNYLAGFEQKQIHEATNVLTSFSASK